MDKGIIEYIKSLVEKNAPDGRKMLAEGRAIGESFEIPKNKFLRKYGYETYLDYRKDCARQGKIVWQLLVGLSTLEEEIEAVRTISEFSDRTNLNIRSMQSIPSMLVGLPREYWDNAPKPTSYLMDGQEAWLAHSEAAPVNIAWQDWHLSSPNCLATTIYALKAGSPRIGTFSQFIWDYPGWDDEIGRFSDMVRSLGIIASKRDMDITADTYPEDGPPGHFFDTASYLGYEMLEHYIIEELCGAKMSLSFGGLLTDPQPRMAFAMAMHKLYATEDSPILSYYNGGTTDQWDHDINANFGPSVLEMMLQILVELKYNMMGIISPVAITERLRVPTLQELMDIAAAGCRAEEKARDWLPLMDFTLLERMRDDMIEKGTLWFNNAMTAFNEAGVDTKDPLQMILVLKRFNPMRLEQSFHPSVQEKGEFEPYYPTAIGQSTTQLYRNKQKWFIENGYENALLGKKLIAVSADGHSYGLMYVERVLHGLGAVVINGGVDVTAPDLLDLADEEGVTDIFVSLHCGQVLDYSRLLSELAEVRGRKYRIFVGGMLNGMLPGNTEPVDVTDILCELGVYPSNELRDAVDIIKEAG